MFGDDRPYGASVVTAIEGIWEHFEPFWGSSSVYQLPYSSTQNSPIGAIFEMGACNDCQFNTPAEVELWTPGTDGVLDILNSTGVTWIGDLATILANATSAPFLSNNMNPSNWRFLADGWQGVSCFSCGYSAAGTVLAYPAAGAGVPTASAGTAGERVFGVSMGATGNNPIVATSGVANVTLGGATTAANTSLRTAASGKAVQASGANDTTTPVIGWSNYGASASGSQVPVHLRIGGP